MTRKDVVLISVVAVAFALYVYYFTDWLVPPRIRILCQNRVTPLRRRRAQVYPVSFTLDGLYRLTSVEVIPVSALATNKHAAPIWHLVSRTNSTPVQGFFYGMYIRGMHPAIPRERPQPLEPGASYRLFVRAGRARGQIDFRPRGLDPAGN